MTVSVACGETRIEALVGDPLNPETHRAEIVAIDAIVFENGPLREADRETVVKTLLGLSKVAAADKANVIATSIGGNLRTLATMTSRLRTGTSLPSSPLPKHWLRLRSSLFDDVWWFRRSSADPIAPAIAESPPQSPRRHD
jgi:hypothetical protein